MENKKRNNISQKYKLYLFGLAAFLMLSFIVLGSFIMNYKIEQDKKILRDKIYADKQMHIKNQVLSAIGSINILRDSIEFKMKHDLKSRVDEAYDIAMNLYNVNKDKYSEKQIKHFILEALRTPRFFNGRGYYFINEEDGLSILHPIDKSIENDYNKNNSLFFNKLRNKDAAYVNYDWNIKYDLSNYTYRKTSYIRRFSVYNWLIGTGDYVEYVNKDLKERALKKLSEISYDKKGYILVFDIDGNIIHSRNKKINKLGNLRNYKADHGLNLYEDIKKLALKEGGGFFPIRWEEDDKVDTDYEVYMKYLDDWKWMIGGFTHVDLIEDIIKSKEATLSKDLYKISFIIIAFILLTVLIVIMFGRRIQIKIDQYFQNFYTEFEKAESNKSLMSTEGIVFEEKFQLVSEINRVLEQSHINNTRLVNREKELIISNNTKDRFFSIIAHDLKNPFNSLMGILEILLHEYDELDDSEKKDYLHVLSRSSNTLFKLLKDLLQWSRLQTSGFVCKQEHYLIEDVVDKQIKIVEEQANVKSIKIKSDISGKDIVDVDINMISTVVRNLLSNAIKFTNTDGLIILSTDSKGDMLEVSIKDNGIGMGEDILSNLFRIDEKISTIGTANESGTGLGLILCKEFVEKNGGSIKVSSKEGEGSCFSFTVSLAKE